MAGLNILQSIESDIIHLLSGSPLMPPTVLVRPFQEELVENGRVFSNDNVIYKFDGMSFDPFIESNDVISVKWIVDFEIMLILRDFRGHHAMTQLIETILFLLTDYKPMFSSRAIVPRSASFTQYDENSFRYFSMKFDVEVDICDHWYEDPYEAVPGETRCLDDCTKWLGLNEEGQYNICWRRYQIPGEDKYRYYNWCGQREGDESRNRWFADGTKLNPDFGNNPEGILTGPSGPTPRTSFNMNLGLWRNTSETFPSRDEDGKFGDLFVKTGEDIVVNHARSCCGG